MKANHRCFIIACLALLLVMPAAESGDRLRGAVALPAGFDGGQPVQLYSGSYALLIANWKYQHWDSLLSIPKEMAQVKAALEAQGFEIFGGKVHQNVSEDDLRNLYEAFIDKHGFQKRNRLVLYYSGHGFSRSVQGSTKGYIVPVDAPNALRDETEFVRKAIDMGSVASWMKRIESLHALFLFDSCFSGTILTVKGKFPAAQNQAVAVRTRDPIRMYITAGAANETVPAKSTFSPAFVDALSKGKGDLNDDGYILGSELAEYLKNEVATYVGNKVQSGTVKQRDLAQGEILFLAKDIIGGPPAPPPPPPPPERPWRRVISERHEDTSLYIIFPTGYQILDSPSANGAVVRNVSESSELSVLGWKDFVFADGNGMRIYNTGDQWVRTVEEESIDTGNVIRFNSMKSMKFKKGYALMAGPSKRSPVLSILRRSAELEIGGSDRTGEFFMSTWTIEKLKEGRIPTYVLPLEKLSLPNQRNWEISPPKDSDARVSSYSGRIGTEDFTINLQWHDNASVTGGYSLGGTYYTIKGSNLVDGFLIFTVYESNQRMGEMRLRKANTSSQIVWQGDFKSPEGDRFVRFSR